MWYFSIYNSILLKNNKTPINKKKIILLYTNIFIIIISCFSIKNFKNNFFTNKYFLIKNFFFLMLEHKIINIKYKGKIFKIKKKKKIFLLLLNYTGYNYLIWKDLRIKKRKRKKIIFMYILSNNNIKINFFKNLIKLRRLNTYTKRGVYNNIFIHYSRKRRLNTHR